MMEGMKPFVMTEACPCGRQHQKKTLPYGQCCGRWLESESPAPDAESLMRSRYCAFVLEREPYLRKTWQASHRPERIEFDPGVKWLGLDVVEGQVLRENSTMIAMCQSLGFSTRLDPDDSTVMMVSLPVQQVAAQLLE